MSFHHATLWIETRAPVHQKPNFVCVCGWGGEVGVEDVFFFWGGGVMGIHQHVTHVQPTGLL